LQPPLHFQFIQPLAGIERTESSLHCIIPPISDRLVGEEEFDFGDNASKLH
jgi:hypothetical protein